MSTLMETLDNQKTPMEPGNSFANMDLLNAMEI